MVINAADVNVAHNPESDSFSIEASDARGRRAGFVLEEKYVRFLADTYRKTRSLLEGQKPHCGRWAGKIGAASAFPSFSITAHFSSIAD
jgi:hypothetical protein